MMVFVITQRGKRRLQQLRDDYEGGAASALSTIGFIELGILGYVQNNEPVRESDLEEFVKDYEDHVTIESKRSAWRKVLTDGTVSYIDAPEPYPYGS